MLAARIATDIAASPKGRIGAKMLALLVAGMVVPTGSVPAQPVAAHSSGITYQRRVVDIAMRDGVTLHTVIMIPQGARDLPILLTRTPYDAQGLTGVDGASAAAPADAFDNPAAVLAGGGYIRVMQDIRGQAGSGGTFTVTRPLAHIALNPEATDESTDAYDTIAWLVANLPQSNGKVGLIGTSYDGFTTLMGLVGAHPAVKVAVAINPMVDGWRGDDWFHNGAFRQLMVPGIWAGRSRDPGPPPWEGGALGAALARAGSAGAFGAAHGLDAVPFWRDVTAHPAYDAFWQAQAVDRVLAARPPQVPLMLVHSLWDQEDIYGAMALWRALRPHDPKGERVFLTLGPWRHAQALQDGSAVGDLQWDHDTAGRWQRDVLAPFLGRYLRGEQSAKVARVNAFRSGAGIWHGLPDWPTGIAGRKLYLLPGRKLGFTPATGRARTEDYLSDPAHPVPYAPASGSGAQWDDWLTGDQRHAAARPDVLTFTSQVLRASVTIAGQPVAVLSAATSGSDSDWIVKLIDEDATGRQTPLAMDILRGRYRRSLARPEAITPDRLLPYRFALPEVSHVFAPGHRIVVQVQSSWFPLYDRNPQTFVPNIFFAKPADYRAGRQRIAVSGGSFVELPIITEDAP